MDVAWLLHVCCMAVACMTWLLHASCMAVACRLHGCRMDIGWLLPECCMGCWAGVSMFQGCWMDSCLWQCTVEELDSNDGSRFEFELKDASSRHVVALAAESETERSRWLSYIILHSASGGGGSPSDTLTRPIDKYSI